MYSTELKISGDLWGLRNELRKLERGEIRVFNLVEGQYRRSWDVEGTIEKSLREDIKKCEEAVRSSSSDMRNCMAMERGFSRIV